MHDEDGVKSFQTQVGRKRAKIVEAPSYKGFGLYIYDPTLPPLEADRKGGWYGVTMQPCGRLK